MSELKALSIQQPWAGLILLGLKGLETRTWTTDYRGPLVIHAGKRYQKEADSYLWDSGFPEVRDALNHPICKAMGGLIGVVDLEGVVRWKPDLKPKSLCEAYGCFGFDVRNPRILPEAIPWAGQLKLFDLPNDVVQAIEKMVGI
ncbi:ASCH domain-containing protein [bacterium]|nr:ASCH domain-containing protein [bacterium]